MKVLHIITRMNTGGPAVFLDHLTSSLFSFDCENVIAYGKCEFNEIDYLDFKKLNCKVIKIDSLHRTLNPIDDLIAFLQIRKVIKSVKPDVINTHTSKAGVLGRLAAKSINRKIPVAHTFHGHLIYGYFAKFKSLIFTVIEKLMSLVTDLFIAVTSETKSSLQNLGIARGGNWAVIPIGIPIVDLPNPISNKDQMLNLLWVGRFTDIKDPNYAINTFKLLTQINQNSFALTMVGEGEMYEEIKEKSKDLPIKFTGWLKKPFEQIKDFDLLLLTSKNEGLPLVMLEAANRERATVSRDVGGVSEFIKNGITGFLVSGDHSEMAKVILELAANKNKVRDAGIAAKNLLKVEFSVEIMARRYFDAYKELVI